MKNRIAVVAAACIGVAIGVCVRDVGGDALAQPAGGRLEYKVVGASMSLGGYQKDLNSFTAEGWRYVGALPMSNGGPALVFERDR